jgi:superfamily II DNA or RNA helicase
VQAVTVVTPTEHLKRQWADAAHRVGISLDAEFRNAAGAAGRDFAGVAVTYAQVASHPVLHQRRTETRRTLVILDEIHHAGDALSWGDAVRDAFVPATRRLALTGTPFRSDVTPIPFVTYSRRWRRRAAVQARLQLRVRPALRDGVVRPVIFLAYTGQVRWRTSAGDEVPPRWASR